MSETIMIPIPAPPEGWVFDGIRKVKHGENVYDSGRWEVWTAIKESFFEYPVAIPIPPKWTPPPEWAALFGHCWLTRDVEPQVALHKEQPIFRVPFWSSPNSIICTSSFILPNMLPPKDIPADQCCWEIGG